MLILNYHRKIYRSESGHMFFYSVVLVPIALTLSVLAVDVSAWSSLGESAQKSADRIAFTAARALPDKNLALSIAIQESARLTGIQLDSTNTSVTTNSISVGLISEHSAKFDIVLEAIGLGEKVFRVSKSATVQVVPTDYVMILPDGETLRPRRINPSTPETPWGNSGDWPASAFFNCSAPTVNPPSDQWSWNADMWNNDDFRRWATQSCFNPVLSNLKAAAITLVDSLTAIETNRLGLIFTPGNTSNAGFTIARTLKGNNPTEISKLGFGSNGEPLSARWSSNEYREYFSALGDEACVLFSNPDSALNFRYALPSLSSDASLANILGDNWQGCGSPFLPYQNLNANYFENLQVREAIYWHSAKLSNPDIGFNATPNIPEAIKQGIVQLFSETNDELTQSATVRGQLAYKTQKKIILFTDTLPSSASPEFLEILDTLRGTQAQLIILSFTHQGLTPTQETDLITKTNEFISLATNLDTSPEDRGLLRVFQANTPEELNQTLATKIILIGRDYALKS
jgi:hypothetical protein